MKKREFIALAALVACVVAVLTQAPAGQIGTASIVVSLAALALELRALVSGRQSPFSCAAAFYLAACYDENIGPSAALTIAILGTSIRSLWLQSGEGLRGQLADLLSVAAGCTAFLVASDLSWSNRASLTAIGFLLCSEVVANSLYRHSKEERMSRRRFAIACIIGSIPASVLIEHEPGVAFFLLPLLLIVQHGGHGLLMRIRKEEVQAMEQGLRSAKKDLKSAKRESVLKSKQVKETRLERELVENLVGFFARNPSIEEILRGCLDATVPLVNAEARTIWKKEEKGDFKAVHGRGTKGRVPSQRFLQSCWDSGEFRTQFSETGGYFCGAPLPGQGVVSFTLSEPLGLTDRHLDLLSIVLSQFALGLEAALYRARLETSLRLQEKTNEELKLSQSQLVQSSKMAAVGQLAAGVAHELNSPLGATLLQIQMGKMRLEAGKTEKVMHSLEVSETSLGVAQEIIDKLLRFSRASDSAPIKVRLQDCVERAWEMLRGQVESHGVELTLELGEEDLYVMGSPIELQQVFTNLILNARDAAAANQEVNYPHICIGLKGNESRCFATVSDSGAGVVEEAKERLFEPFFTTKLVGEGTGLGLSISFQIIESHSGEISLEPSDVGATFLVDLPRVF